MATARWAGGVYLLFMVVAIIGEFGLPGFVVAGDAAATAANLAEREATYRLGMLLGFATHVVFLVLVVLLYRLFKDVHEGHALLMVLLVAVGVAVALANMLQGFTALVLLRESATLAGLDQPALDALVYQSLRARARASAVPTLFWGLWLFPFGVLVIRSGFLPRLLGWLLIVAGIGYLTAGATQIALPEYGRRVGNALMPLYFGELPIIFWLAFVGARARLGASAAQPRVP